MPVCRSPGTLYQAAARLRDPFLLTPGFAGPRQPEVQGPVFDSEAQVWVVPFAMAAINICNVHRSNLLQHHAYGPDFIYQEATLAGEGPQGREAAESIIAATSALWANSDVMPGDGPGRTERETGGYRMRFIGYASGGSVFQCFVTGDMDPGYGSTAKIVAETAMCLSQTRKSVPGGIWTPCAALGSELLRRLEANAGVSVSSPIALAQ